MVWGSGLDRRCNRTRGIDSSCLTQPPCGAHSPPPPPPNQQKRLWAGARVQRLCVQSEELQRSELFTSLDDGVSALFILILPDGAHPMHGRCCSRVDRVGSRRVHCVYTYKRLNP